MFNLPIKILKTIQLQTAQASVTFSGINTLVAQWDAAKKVTSRHLVLIVNAASPDAVDARTLQAQFNGDVGANYNQQRIWAANIDYGADINPGVTFIPLGPIPGTNYGGGLGFGGGIVLIPHAFNTVNHKASLSYCASVEHQLQLAVNRWASVAAITSVILYPSAGNFAAGSTFHLGVVDERYLVREVLLAAPAAEIVFPNIPQGEGDLTLIAYARGDWALVSDTFSHNFNDDAGANYLRQYLEGAGAIISAGSGVAVTVATMPAATATANVFGAVTMNYSQYIKGNQPHFRGICGFHESTGPTGDLVIRGGRRANIEAINKLRYFYVSGANFVAGTLFSLYRVPKRIIQRQELTAPQAVVTFANIPQNFEGLLLHVYTKTDRAAASDPIRFTINADAVAANYDTQKLDGTGAVVTAARSLADRDWLLVSGSGGGSPANQFDGGSILFPAYNKTDRHKHAVAKYGPGENNITILSARWESLTAITSISMTPVNGPNFLTGSVFELEGILRKEGLPPIEGSQWGV